MITKLNRLTKTGTVSFRGEKRTTLLDFGTFFNLEAFKDGIWKLVPIKIEEENDDLVEEQEDAEALNDSEIDKEIENIMAEDDLPF